LKDPSFVFFCLSSSQSATQNFFRLRLLLAFFFLLKKNEFTKNA
jgi:hypothetical protein